MAVDGVVLHLLCGHIAAGKSTLAGQLGSRPLTVVIEQDLWIARLFGDQIATLGYARCAGRFHRALEPHLVALLHAGVSVVLDLPVNTLNIRRWIRGIIERTGVRHQLHYLEVPTEVCRERLRERNAEGGHPFRTSERLFEAWVRAFVPPRPEEGFEIVVHRFETDQNP